MKTRVINELRAQGHDVVREGKGFILWNFLCLDWEHLVDKEALRKSAIQPFSRVNKKPTNARLIKAADERPPHIDGTVTTLGGSYATGLLQEADALLEISSTLVYRTNKICLNARKSFFRISQLSPEYKITFPHPPFSK